uniref:Uncharacterized protein n=1 Tax=viral metagenome TaxID=1070528 RepID=A0A6M3JUW4_9ZZZZ
MKVMSFTCRPDDEIYLKCILPALLDKTKTQTIRPAWKVIKCKTVQELQDKVRWNLQHGATEFDSHLYYGLEYEKKIELDRLFWTQYRIKVNQPTAIITTQSRFKFGDQIQKMWKHRSSPKGSWFCKKCGQLVGGELKDSSKPVDHSNCIRNIKIVNWGTPNSQGWIERYKQAVGTFPKILGTVKITEVFKIEMWKSFKNIFFIRKIPDMKLYRPYKELAKRDGFKSAEDMFRWFDKQYDLSVPKQFYVYQWGGK